MRVLFVSSGNSKFGIIPFIKTQGESLRDNGVELEFFAIKGKGFKGYLKNIPKLRRSLKSNNYDIIHAHYGFCGTVSQLAKTKEKLIVSFMGDDLYGILSKENKQTNFGRFNILLSKLFSYFPERVIVKSRYMYNYIPKYNQQKTTIIPNGVDFNIFKSYSMDKARQELGLEKGKKYILFLGDKNEPRKNYSLLLKSLNYIMYSRIEILCPFPEPHEKIPVYMNAANVLTLLSKREGSPNVIKEAMACNLPIVSTDVGDVREVIRDTEGCYITSFDPKEVAKKIQMALDFGKRTDGRKNIKHLEINNIAKKITSIYQQVLNKK